MDLLKDYDCKILYYLDKGNVVVNALRQKKSVMLDQLLAFSWRMFEMIHGLCLNYYGNGTYLTQIQIQPILFMKIWEAQATYQEILKHINKFASDKV